MDTRAQPTTLTAASCPSLHSTLSTSSSFKPSLPFFKRSSRLPSASQPECVRDFLPKYKGLQLKELFILMSSFSYAQMFPQDKGNIKYVCLWILRMLGMDDIYIKETFMFFSIHTNICPLDKKVNSWQWKDKIMFTFSVSILKGFICKRSCSMFMVYKWWQVNWKGCFLFYKITKSKNSVLEMKVTHVDWSCI